MLPQSNNLAPWLISLDTSEGSAILAGMRLELSKCVIRSWRLADAPALVKHGNNRNVWINLRDLFPHPYTRAAAAKWLKGVRQQFPETSFSIAVDDEAVGGIGFHLHHGMDRYSAEIGYWLGESHWDRGIATEALRAVTAYSFSKHELRRIYALVFEWNAASMRVLEKCGYKREGWLKQSVIKDDKIIDQALYAILRDEL